MNNDFRYIKAPAQDVVLSSRVRLSRNFRDMPFSPRMDGSMTGEAVRRVCDVILGRGADGVYTFLRIADLNEDAKGRLLEHDLIDESMLRASDRASVLISSGSTISLMMAGEDHVAIQALLPGLQADRVAQMAFRVDEKLSQQYAFAFDNDLGYLTASPLLAGTGMRISFLMHLPALSRAGKMNDVLQQAGKAGMVIRPVGAVKDGTGHLYRLFNQVTLGKSEEDILAAAVETAETIVSLEHVTRDASEKQDMLKMQDMLLRSWGEVTQARLMSRKEWLRRWSDIRYAASMGYLHLPLQVLDEMLNDLGDASIRADSGKVLGEREQEILRAAILREKLPEAMEHYTDQGNAD